MKNYILRQGLHARRDAIRAFSLLELLVVIAIIAMLGTLVVTQVGNIFGGQQEEVAKLFVRESMPTPLTAYRIAMGDYPTTAEGLQALITPPANKADKWRGPYVKANDGKLALDPWKNPYQYRYPGAKNKNGYDLFSFGPDGVESADDIGNW